MLDHSVSQSSENSHSRTQTVEGGRCVYEQRHVGMKQSWIRWQTCESAALPPKPQKMNNILRNSKDIYNKERYY